MLSKKMLTIIILPIFCLTPMAAQTLSINTVFKGTYYLSLIEIGPKNNMGWNSLAAYLETYVEVVDSGLLFKKSSGELAEIELIKRGIRDGGYSKGYEFNGFVEGSMREGFPFIAVDEQSIEINYDRQSGLDHTQYVVLYTREKNIAPEIRISLETANYINRTEEIIPIYRFSDIESEKIGEIPVWKDTIAIRFNEPDVDYSDYDSLMRIWESLDRDKLQVFTAYGQSIGRDQLGKAKLWYKVKFEELQGYIYIDLFLMQQEDLYWHSLNLSIFGL